MLLGSWWRSNANLKGKGPQTLSFSRTHTLAKSVILGSAGGAGLCTAKRVQGVAGRCRGIMQSRGGVLKKAQGGQEPQGRRSAVGANLAGCLSRLRRRLGGTGAMWCTSWSATCRALISLQSGTTLTSHSSSRNVRTVVDLFCRRCGISHQSVTTKKNSCVELRHGRTRWKNVSKGNVSLQGDAHHGSRRKLRAWMIIHFHPKISTVQETGTACIWS